MKFNIFDLLLPRETKFYDFLREQVDVLIEAGKIFRNVSQNHDNMSEDEIKKEISRIKECEKKSDAVEVKIISALDQTFITPFDREDIHSMTINIDRALDTLTSLSYKIEIYQIKKFPISIYNFSEIIVEISEQLKILVTELEKKNNIDPIIKNMHELEHKADYLFYISAGELFKDYNDPIEIIKLKEVYEFLENVVDSIDYIGKIVRRVMIKQG
jgi:uncharacterized protein